MEHNIQIPFVSDNIDYNINEFDFEINEKQYKLKIKERRN